MNGSYPRKRPVILRDPFSARRSRLSMYFLSSGGKAFAIFVCVWTRGEWGWLVVGGMDSHEINNVARLRRRSHLKNTTDNKAARQPKYLATTRQFVR